MTQPISDYERRVRAYEAQDITRSDAQGIVEAEDMTQAKQGKSWTENADEIDRLRAVNAELRAALENILKQYGTQEDYPNFENEPVKQARAILAKATQ
jgi:hypothetical protein